MSRDSFAYMDFDRISSVGLARAGLWHPGGLEDWTVSDWTVATLGEGGEVLNSIKKLKRVEQKISQKAGPQDMRSAQLEVGTEVGDTYLYLDLLAQRIGSTPWKCVCIVPGGYRHFYEGDTLQSMGLHLMIVMGAIAVLAVTADMATDPIDRSRQLDYMQDKIGRCIELLGMIAERVDLDLQTCVVDTFNRVSIREDFPQRL